MASVKVRLEADSDTPAADDVSDTTTCDPAAGLEPTDTLSCPLCVAPLRSRAEGAIVIDGATLLAHCTAIATGASAA